MSEIWRGVRRFPVYKNQSCFEHLGHYREDQAPDKHAIMQLQRQLEFKNRQIRMLKDMMQSKPSVASLLNQKSLKIYASQPQLRSYPKQITPHPRDRRVVMYTKAFPKVVRTNPITGITTTERRNLSNFGALLINK